MGDNKKSGINLHLLVALLIITVIGIGAYKLWKWDKSGDIVLEEIEPGTYDYESLDVVFTVDKDILESREADGINNILCIGDYVWTVRDSNGVGFADYLRRLPDSDVEVICSGDSKIADVQNAYNNNNVTEWQAGYLYDMTYALCTGDYSLQKRAFDRGDIIDENLYNGITSVDMQKVDTLLIFYGSKDYVSASVLYNPEDKYDTATYEGALRASVSMIQEYYPHIRIIVASPYLHGVVKDGNVVAASLVNYGNGNLSEYTMRAYNIAMECCVSYIDMFFGLINENNINDYCNVDLLLDSGVDLLGNHLLEYMERKY